MKQMEGALRAIHTTVLFMHDILVDQIKLLPLPEDLREANRTWSSPVKGSAEHETHHHRLAFVTDEYCCLDLGSCPSGGNRESRGLSPFELRLQALILAL